MKLVHKPGKVLAHAWSVRLMYVAAAFSAAEIALPIIDQFISIPRGVFAGLSAFTTFGAVLSRLVVQEKLKVTDDADQ